jgi:hypothetical protein
MKKQILCFLICCVVGIQASFAADFSSVNSDGVTIYYNITNSNSGSYAVEVTSGSSKYSGAVSIPDTVTYNGITYKVTSLGSAFQSCTGLTSITIPSKVTTLVQKAFSGCTALADVYFNADSCYCSASGSALMPFVGCTGLQKIIIGDNVKAITYQMFRSCSTATTLYIGKSVRDIGTYAFTDCSSLTSVNIPSSVKHIGKYAFKNCVSLKCSLTIPNSVVSIEQSAFNGCTGLKDTLYISNSVNYIGDNAFLNCSGVSYLSLGNSVDTITSSAFSGLTGISTLTIPASLKNIQSSAFANCTGLTSVIYNADSCIFSGASLGVFSGCTALKTVVINNNVKAIPSNLFPQCTKLSDLTLGSAITNIGSGSFSNCTALTGALVIPNSVKVIGSSAFSGCSGLSGLTLNNSLDSIGDFAFTGCSGLKDSLAIPNSVKYIGGSAFLDCSGYTKISIGSSVSYLGTYCFSGFSNLTKVYCLGTTPPDAYTELFGSSELAKAKIYTQATLYVPSAGYKLYSKMEPWKNFDIVAFDFSLQVIPTASGAKFTWTPTTGAESYVLTIYSNASKTDTVCVLTFNGYGQLTALALRSADTDAGGFNFTVSSLSSSKDYYCDMNVYNSSNQLLSTKSVTFQTSGTSGLSDSKTETGKIFARNHTIIAEGVSSAMKVYNLSGCLIGSATYKQNTTQEINVPASGIYIVRVDNKTQKVIVK